MEKINRKIVLQHGGKLVLFYDEYDEDKDIDYIQHKTLEIDGVVPPYYLHELDFELGEGVILEDVFLFLKKDLPYWEIMLGNSVSDYVNQSFEPTPEGVDLDSDPTLEKVYLSWSMEANKMDGKKFVHNPFPTFNGEGKSGGVTCNVGFGGLHVSVLNKLPIEIRDNLTVYYDNFDMKFPLKKRKGENFIDSLNRRTLLEKIFPFWRRFKYWVECKISRKSYNFGSMSMSLFSFLYGIFYELSFYGSPSERKSFFDGLSAQVDEIKKGNYDSET